MAPIEILYAAIGARIGVVVQTNNRELCRQKLYAARKASNDPDLDQLEIRLSKHSPDLLYVMKRPGNAKETVSTE